MHIEATYHSYESTGLFPLLVTDYLKGKEELIPFYSFAPNTDGVKKAINQRRLSPVNRQLLFDEWTQQYASVNTNEQVKNNIRSILQENTFTVCTAHQPNIFTGPLYFIYKIFHAIRMAEDLNQQISDCHFVPVYFMGSEDADLEELGVVTIGSASFSWQTSQKGAVGRMKVDDGVIEMIARMEQYLKGQPYATDIIGKIKGCYTKGKLIQQATFEFVHLLFNRYGLLVLIPDNSSLKKECTDIFKKELKEGFSKKALSKTIGQFPSKYKLQTEGRDVNLFYLKEDLRLRIDKAGDGFAIANSDVRLDESQMMSLLEDHPECFSPNVILRPLLQERLLPNVVFIGGGAEVSYWLELKSVFEAIGLNLPVLILRNSFLWMKADSAKKIAAWNMAPVDLLRPIDELYKNYLLRHHKETVSLSNEIDNLAKLYEAAGQKAKAADVTLVDHVAALHKQAKDKLVSLEQKIIRAEKKKQAPALQVLSSIRNEFFPMGNLQERVFNITSLYSEYGDSFMDFLYEYSESFSQQICILAGE